MASLMNGSGVVYRRRQHIYIRGDVCMYSYSENVYMSVLMHL